MKSWLLRQSSEHNGWNEANIDIIKPGDTTIQTTIIKCLMRKRSIQLEWALWFGETFFIYFIKKIEHQQLLLLSIWENYLAKNLITKIKFSIVLHVLHVSYEIETMSNKKKKKKRQNQIKVTLQTLNRHAIHPLPRFSERGQIYGSALPLIQHVLCVNTFYCMKH